jgi:hypothetical protein
LLLDPDDAILDELLGAIGAIPEKRFSHKRALEVDGILVELFIARSEGGTYMTWFWDQLRWPWPADLAVTVADLRLASREALAGYRSNWAAIQAARPSSI